MHNLSVMAIFKNESLNLKIWINHYIWQGVDHFFLIDNDSSDNPKSILEPYINSRKVTYFFRPAPHQQLDHYRSVYKFANIPSKTKWLIIADLDEFFYGLKNKISRIVPLFQNVRVLYCNWIMFGSDGLINHPADIRTAITKRDQGFHTNTKYIFKTKYILAHQLFIHHIDVGSKKYLTQTINHLIHLNHYPIQSWEFFEKVKMTRGDVNTKSSDTIRNKKYFVEYNQNKNQTDEYLKQLVLLNNR